MKSNEWYTPAKYIEAAREVMGSIDLDPASCALANETVRATKYYTQEEDGLTKEWYGNVWLNPPYSLVYRSSGMNHVCFAHDRVYFERPGLPPEKIMFGTLFCYIGPHEDRFTRIFSQFGTIARRVEVPA